MICTRETILNTIKFQVKKHVHEEKKMGKNAAEYLDFLTSSNSFREQLTSLNSFREQP